MLKEFYSELNELLIYKIKKNSKAYVEIKQLLINLNTKIIHIDNDINKRPQVSDTSYINLKMETSVYKTLVSLKNELNIKTMSELLRLFESYYKEECVISNLSVIEPIDISKDIKLALNRTNYYLCSCNEKTQKIIYKIEDIIIFNDIEYLDLNKFNELEKFGELFLFSSNYTLNDVNEFFTIYREGLKNESRFLK